ncbi:MAG: type III secretion protein [Deltaproteobacteria bacterium]|nr:type III secretion protein [Deltaproteobacteria bacterium]
MIDYPLEDLLALRVVREEAAQREFVLAERALKQAIEREREKKKALEDYRLLVETEKEARYDAIMGAEMTKDDIEEFRAGLSELDRKVLVIEEDLQKAIEETKDCQKQLENCRQARLAALKAKEKIELHKEIWLEKSKKEAEKVEENEIDEFSVRSIF